MAKQPEPSKLFWLNYRHSHLPAGSLESATRKLHHELEQWGMPEMRDEYARDMAPAIIRAYVDALSRTAG
jgi:hypothetical protein